MIIPSDLTRSEESSSDMAFERRGKPVRSLSGNSVCSDKSAWSRDSCARQRLLSDVEAAKMQHFLRSVHWNFYDLKGDVENKLESLEASS